MKTTGLKIKNDNERSYNKEFIQMHRLHNTVAQFMRQYRVNGVQY